MSKKRTKDIFSIELAGGFSGVLMILFALAAFIDTENISIYFTVIIGIGSILNCILAILQFCKKSYLLGSILAALSAALLVLFVIQILILKG